MTVLYFPIIIVFWLLNLCRAGGDASFAPQENVVLFETKHLQILMFQHTFLFFVTIETSK